MLHTHRVPGNGRRARPGVRVPGLEDPYQVMGREAGCWGRAACTGVWRNDRRGADETPS